MRNRITAEEPTGEIIATFGTGTLIRTRDGSFEFRGGTKNDLAEATEWASMFMPEIVVQIDARIESHIRDKIVLASSVSTSTLPANSPSEDQRATTLNGGTRGGFCLHFARTRLPKRRMLPNNKRSERERMKTLSNLFRQRKWMVWFATAASGALMLTVWISIGRADLPFGLTIQVTNSSQLALTITNAVSTTAYEIQRRQTLEAINPWVHETNGTPGQTNFTVNMSIYTMGFFQALPCIDCDWDGIENWKDADPYNAAVGILTITIDSPAHGTIFN